MRAVGITGGIGSGKSYVAQVLRALGYPVYDCDVRAKALYNEDSDLKERLVGLWGEDLYDTGTGLLVRQRLAEIIFADKEALALVNSLVHPRVRADFEAWKRRELARGAAIVFIESAIIIGSPLEQMIDELWAVVARDELRLERAIRRDGATMEAIYNRMAHQASQEVLMSQARHIIYNNLEEPILSQIYAGLRDLNRDRT